MAQSKHQGNLAVSAHADEYRLQHPAEVRETILRYASALPLETVAISDAAWRVLGKDLVAPEDHPPFPAATMDGFAVLAEDHSPWREILGDQMAGRVQDLEVTPGTAVRITTGAPLPKGADAVVQVELTEPAEDHVIIHDENVSPGQNVPPRRRRPAQGGPATAGRDSPWSGRDWTRGRLRPDSGCGSPADSGQRPVDRR